MFAIHVRVAMEMYRQKVKIHRGHQVLRPTTFSLQCRKGGYQFGVEAISLSLLDFKRSSMPFTTACRLVMIILLMVVYYNTNVCILH